MLIRKSFFLFFAIFFIASCSTSPDEEDDTPITPLLPSDGELQVTNNDLLALSQSDFAYDTSVWKPNSGVAILRDKITDSLFNLHGQAFEGPLAAGNEKIVQLYTFNSYWFAWSIFYPGSEIWGSSLLVNDAIIKGDDNCLVPCNEIRSACSTGEDCIPSLPNAGPPKGGLRFVEASSPEASYLIESDIVIGIFDGIQARAYPRRILWWHEIANDNFAQQDLSVTLCPLTGSSLVFPSTSSFFGVSGKLYNSNLVMYDHESGSLWPQMRRQSVIGNRKGDTLQGIPFVESTWASWVNQHPDSWVLDSDTGFRRDYSKYPYDDYRTDNNNTFSTTNPLPDVKFPAKKMTTGLVTPNTERVYVHSQLQSLSGQRKGVIKDEIDGKPIVIVFDLDAFLVLIFALNSEQAEIDLEWTVAP